MKRGLTLPELMVAMGLAGFVAILMMSTFLSGVTLSRRFLGEENVFRRAHEIADRVTEYVHESDLTLAAYQTDAFAIPAARQNTVFATDPKTGLPVWNQTCVVYASGRELRMNIVEQASGWPLKTIPRTGGELLTNQLASLNVTMENVTVWNDPIAQNSTVPATTNVTALLHLKFSLSFHNRMGLLQKFEYEDRLEGWNSYTRLAPPVPDSPTPTPTPPMDAFPSVPPDWSN